MRWRARARPRVSRHSRGKHVLAGPHPVEVHAITGSGHNDAFSLVYLPAQKILVEADAYSPGALGAPVPTPPNPYTVNLADNLKRLGLEVWQIAALHGPRVVTFEDLRIAAGLVTPAPPTIQRRGEDRYSGRGEGRHGDRTRRAGFRRHRGSAGVAGWLAGIHRESRRSRAPHRRRWRGLGVPRARPQSRMRSRAVPMAASSRRKPRSPVSA